jgi:hypothetical protein
LTLCPDRRLYTTAPFPLRATGVTSLYGIARALNERGIPTATGRGKPQVRHVLERITA